MRYPLAGDGIRLCRRLLPVPAVLFPVPCRFQPCFLMWFVHRLLLRLSESVKIDVSYIAPYIAVACVPCHNRFLCAVPKNRLRPIRVLGYIPEIKGKPVQQLRFDIAGSVTNTAGASDTDTLCRRCRVKQSKTVPCKPCKG